MSPFAGVALGLALAALLPLTVQAATPSTLAAQVNAQIVQREVNEGVAAMAGASGAGLMPRDLPTGCEPAMRSAVAGMSAELVRFMQAAFNDPTYQRAFEQQLSQAYTAEQLQAFLDRREANDLDGLSADVMSAPGLQAAQDAHLAGLTDVADASMDADPGVQKALAAVRGAQERCDALRMEAAQE
jgi:hypothetical protein